LPFESGRVAAEFDVEAVRPGKSDPLEVAGEQAKWVRLDVGRCRSAPPVDTLLDQPFREAAVVEQIEQINLRPL
jgi:hypothetical protein